MRLQECREENEMSIEEAAVALNISPEALHSLESNPDPTLSEQQIRMIAEAYDCPISDLFDDPLQSAINSFLDKERIALLTRLFRLVDQQGDKILEKAEEDMTIADFAFLGVLMESRGEPSNRHLENFVKYMTLLTCLDVPVLLKFKNMNPAQIKVHEGSTPYLEALAQYRCAWAIANSEDD